MIAQHTTTRMTADQIHQLGLKEVARLNIEMDATLKQVGYAEGSLAQRIAKVKLGDKFKLSTFHDEVLQNGALPLSVLERVIDEYIAHTAGLPAKS